MKPIGRLTAENWVAHLALILAAAAAAAVLASRAEGELLRKVLTVALGVLAVMLILQTVVESAAGAPRSYRLPYPICAAASIKMIEGQMMQTEPVIAGTGSERAPLRPRNHRVRVPGSGAAAVALDHHQKCRLQTVMITEQAESFDTLGPGKAADGCPAHRAASWCQPDP